MKSTPALLAAVSAALLTGAVGCTNPDPTTGYTDASQYRPGIRTIAVPIWNRGPHEYRLDIENRITEALIKTIQGGPPYKVVPESRADTLLTGTLNRVEQTVLSFDPRFGTAREIQLRFLVDFTWKYLRTGQILVSRKNYRVASTYIPPGPYREDFYLGSEDAVNKLAQRIVEHLAQPW